VDRIYHVSITLFLSTQLLFVFQNHATRKGRAKICFRLSWKRGWPWISVLFPLPRTFLELLTVTILIQEHTWSVKILSYIFIVY
jgi:hypothetical protein